MAAPRLAVASSSRSAKLESKLKRLEIKEKGVRNGPLFRLHVLTRVALNSFATG